MQGSTFCALGKKTHGCFRALRSARTECMLIIRRARKISNKKTAAAGKQKKAIFFAQELQSAALRSKARCGILIKSDYKCGGKHYEQYAGKGIAAFHSG